MEEMLENKPDNKYNNEAILVKLPDVATIGLVANNCHTVIGECYSAGRHYDKIGDTTYGKVMYKTDRGVVCELIETIDK